MLPVCSAVPSCSSHSPISFHVGARAFSPLWKIIEDRHVAKDRPFFCMQDGIRAQDIKTCATRYMDSLFVERHNQIGSLDSSLFSPYTNEFADIARGFSNDYLSTESENWSYSMRDRYSSYPGPEDIKYVENLNISASSPSGDEFVTLPVTLGQSSNTLSEPISASLSASTAMTNTTTEGPVPTPDTFEVANKGLSNLKESIDNFLSGINGSSGTSIDGAEGVAKSIYNTFTLNASDTLVSVMRSVDNVRSGLFSLVDSTREQAASKLSGLSSKLQENTSGAGTVAVDILRQSIVTVEDSLANAATFIVYFYASAKSLLPLNARDVLNITEEKVTEILRPIGASFQQVYIIIEGFEKTLGLDPNDPIVPFIIFLGGSATIGASLWQFNYGGYSGDLAPEATLELLKNDENAVLIDVRPEDSRKRDGIPDLRRGARFKYASVTLQEIDGSVRKMLKGGKEIDDALYAVVIRNLKLVRDGSKVIVMDESGGRSKSIARSLKKLGVKKPYLVQGGFQSWVKTGLSIKELKPETTLTVLNEEAEAILEDIKPTPALIIGCGLGLSAAIYALLEWEKTLQIIGIIGLGQTVYRRLASYEDSDDFKQDVRLLLAPVRLGAEAFSWAARKLEPNKIGLPTSPLSTAVQDRVLQAAAKHESQPSDSEESQGLPREPSGQASENLDLSEA